MSQQLVAHVASRKPRYQVNLQSFEACMMLSDSTRSALAQGQHVVAASSDVFNAITARSQERLSHKPAIEAMLTFETVHWLIRR